MKALAALLTVCLLSVSSLAMADYPERTIRIIVPYPAGGATDTLARQIAQGMSETWGQSVIVDNRPGASGITGSNQVARSRKDGYTLLMGIVALAQLPALHANLPFDVAEDFAPLTEVARSQNLLVVPKSHGIATFEELLARVKAEPGEHSYGSYGNGTSAHIYGEMLKQQTGMDLVHIPYRGAAPLITDVLGERLTLGIVDAGSVRAHLDSGRFNVIAVTGAERSELVPEVPTLGELGLENFDPYGWFGMFAPAGVPEPILETLSTEIARIIHSDEVSEVMRGFGLRPVGNDRETFAETVRSDLDVWTSVIEQTGIRIE
ncbi:tripartite tricarboxylate transporter substrate binding protein [Alcanivorax sp. JB21]|nr:tripartite tricarboxylate transporter substrate binding protein [Alcanivorax limicola]